MEKGTHHISDIRIIIVDHRILEGLQEVLLKLEVRQFFLLQEAHGQLPQRIKSEESNVWIVVAANLQSFSLCKKGLVRDSHLVEVLA